MPNSIAAAKNYTAILDEVYQRETVSTVLNSPRRLMRAGRNAKEIMIPKISVTGLGDYTRNVGYKTGSIDFSYETKAFSYDRGIKLLADVMDVEEAGVMDCFVQTGAELQRTQVAPEADAYSLANPARSNRVPERFSRIVEVPQARFYTHTGGTDGASVLKLGAGGVLTDPEYDVRTCLNATLFADGELEIGFSKADATGREVLASDTLCSNAKYTAIQATPWSAFGKSVKRVTIAADISRVANVNLNYWFYGCNALTLVSGVANLRGVACMNHTFNSCSALTELGLRGISPASLSSMLYAFGACTALERILVDADWELPSGCTGSSTFYNCKAIVGDNGTVYDSKQTTCAMCRIDREGRATSLPGSGLSLQKWHPWRLRRCPSCAAVRGERAAPMVWVRRCNVAACSEDCFTPR